MSNVHCNNKSLRLPVGIPSEMCSLSTDEQRKSTVFTSHMFANREARYGDRATILSMFGFSK